MKEKSGKPMPTQSNFKDLIFYNTLRDFQLDIFRNKLHVKLILYLINIQKFKDVRFSEWFAFFLKVFTNT